MRVRVATMAGAVIAIPDRTPPATAISTSMYEDTSEQVPRWPGCEGFATLVQRQLQGSEAACGGACHRWWRGRLFAHLAEPGRDDRGSAADEHGRDLIDGERRHRDLGDERVAGPHVHLAGPEQVLVELFPGSEAGVDDLHRPGGAGGRVVCTVGDP